MNILATQTKKTRLTSFALASVLLIALGQDSRAADAQKPNIVFILMDNLGYGEVGCYGGRHSPGRTDSTD